MSKPDLDAATQFLAANGRVVDRRRLERLFAGGDATPVRDAVAAYRNPDGGFGQGLEPDGRDPATQPAAIALALGILDEADAWDTGLVSGACDWLQAHAPAEGGSRRSWSRPSRAGRTPRGGCPSRVFPGRATRPRWSPPARSRACCTPAGSRIRGWTRPQTCSWERVGQLSAPGPYDMIGVVSFLNQVPDAARAERALGQIGPTLLGLVALDPEQPGETHSPLSFAPQPGSRARALFNDAVIQAHLDHTAAGQRDDGGWTFNFPAWSPAAELDWRGYITVSALVTLRDNGRL